MAVVTVTEVKAHLNITGAGYDTDLGVFIDRAEAAIAAKCGPLAAESKTERIDGHTSRLVLRSTPVISLTSVTPVDGTALTVGDLYVSPSGVVEYDDGGSFSAARYTVVYQAGRSSVPADLKYAILELVRHFWATQRGPSRRPGSTSSTETANTIAGAAYMMPFRVLELIAPHIQPGFA